MTLWIPVLFVLFGEGLAQAQGHIQIRCEAGVQIFLNGEFKGRTRSEVGGLILENLSAGSYRVKAVKEGFEPQEESVVLHDGQVLLHVVKPFVPKVTVSQEGVETGTTIEAKVGTLIIQSLPIECVLDIPSLDIKGFHKTKDRFIARNVPAGSHKITANSMGKTLQKDIEVSTAESLSVMINFLKGSITIQSSGLGKKTQGKRGIAKVGTLDSKYILARKGSLAEPLEGVEKIAGKIICSGQTRWGEKRIEIILDLEITQEGRAGSMACVKTPSDECCDAVWNVIKETRFKPATIDGSPVRSRLQLVLYVARPTLKLK
jgi:hypothetical protein